MFKHISKSKQLCANKQSWYGVISNRIRFDATRSKSNDSKNVIMPKAIPSYTPSWLHGEKAVGPRVTSFDPVVPNAMISYQIGEFIPLSVKQVWSVFDDYLEFQSAIAIHGKVDRVPDTPENDVGAQVVFTWDGVETKERLTIKDNENYVWQIDIPGPTKVFQQYVGTIRLFEDKHRQGCVANLAMEYQLQDNIIDKQAINNFHNYCALQLYNYPKLIFDCALTKHGETISKSFNIDAPKDFIWKIVSDWKNTDWVAAAIRNEPPEMIAPDIRRIKLNNGSKILERVSILDNESCCLEYQILDQTPNKYRAYKDRVELTSINSTSTKATTTTSFVANDPKESAKLHNMFDQLITSAGGYLQKTLPEMYQQQIKTKTKSKSI